MAELGLSIRKVKAREMNESGITRKAIAEYFKVSAGTITNWIDRVEYELDNAGLSNIDLVKEHVDSMLPLAGHVYEQTMTGEMIATGADKVNVATKILQTHGVISKDSTHNTLIVNQLTPEQIQSRQAVGLQSFGVDMKDVKSIGSNQIGGTVKVAGETDNKAGDPPTPPTEKEG